MRNFELACGALCISVVVSPSFVVRRPPRLSSCARRRLVFVRGSSFSSVVVLSAVLYGTSARRLQRLQSTTVPVAGVLEPLKKVRACLRGFACMCVYVYICMGVHVACVRVPIRVHVRVHVRVRACACVSEQ
jgi:hypothetical protein